MFGAGNAGQGTRIELRQDRRPASSVRAVTRHHTWRGASGKPYVHAVYSLIECPEVPQINYLLVRRERNGNRRVLFVARATSNAPSLNLARIRQRGAQLGANEVHVHVLATTEGARRLIEHDLATLYSDEPRTLAN